MILDLMSPLKKNFIPFCKVLLDGNPGSKSCHLVAAERMLGPTWPRMSPQDNLNLLKSIPKHESADPTYLPGSPWLSTKAAISVPIT